MVWRIHSKERKDAVLRRVVESYIEECRPISSEYLCRKYQLPASSATIRNIMAELGKEGLLVHPYTSSGRIPTPRGFRYYVDFLMEKKEEEEDYYSYFATLKEDIRRRNLNLLLEDISRLVSRLTHYAGLAKIAEEEDKIFFWGTSYILQQPDFSDLKSIKQIFDLLEEKTSSFAHFLEENFLAEDEDLKVLIGDEISLQEISNCSLIISSLNVETDKRILLGTLGPIRMNYSLTLSRLRALKNYLEKEILT
ncbi:MAG: hypothetical protein J7J25_05755 [Candidatus Omnitrophica bacterium]|nr:hypothetical protein [Candidatus Omnitrophota bacterium]